MRRIAVIHWKQEEAGPLLEAVRAAGVDVSYCEEPSATAVIRAIRENPPDAVVIDLSRLPSHGKEIAVWLRNRKATRNTPIVFAGGDPQKVAKLREVIPDAIYKSWESVGAAVKSLPRKPVAGVIAPIPMMQRYGNRTAAQKMGIREGMQVAVIDPPRDYLTVLGQIPDGAELLEDPEAIHPVTIWFLHETEEFLAALPRMLRIAGQTKLWVLWLKGSKNGITQNFIRESGIDAGLVDYKICSVDGRWSGIAFARSKK